MMSSVFISQAGTSIEVLMITCYLVTIYIVQEKKRPKDRAVLLKRLKPTHQSNEALRWVLVDKKLNVLVRHFLDF